MGICVLDEIREDITDVISRLKPWYAFEYYLVKDNVSTCSSIEQNFVSVQVFYFIGKFLGSILKLS